MVNRKLTAASMLLALGSGTAAACGICIEDKVAAVYEYAVVQQAMKDGRIVVFCELAGPFETHALTEHARRAAQALPGVDVASVRIANELPVISFTVDPARQKPDTAVDALRQRMAGDKIVPALLKIMPGSNE